MRVSEKEREELTDAWHTPHPAVQVEFRAAEQAGFSVPSVDGNMEEHRNAAEATTAHVGRAILAQDGSDPGLVSTQSSRWDRCKVGSEVALAPGDDVLVRATIDALFSGDPNDPFPGAVAAAELVFTAAGRREYARGLDRRREEVLAAPMKPRAFALMTDLAIIALASCTIDGDAVSAKSLLVMGGTIYHVPSGASRRVYLQEQFLSVPLSCWHDPHFWTAVMAAAAYSEALKSGPNEKLLAADTLVDCLRLTDVNIVFSHVLQFAHFMAEYGMPQRELESTVEQWMHLGPCELADRFSGPVREFLGGLRGQRRAATPPQAGCQAAIEALISPPRSSAFAMVREALVAATQPAPADRPLPAHASLRA